MRGASPGCCVFCWVWLMFLFAVGRVTEPPLTATITTTGIIHTYALTKTTEQRKRQTTGRTVTHCTSGAASRHQPSSLGGKGPRDTQRTELPLHTVGVTSRTVFTGTGNCEGGSSAFLDDRLAQRFTQNCSKPVRFACVDGVSASFHCSSCSCARSHSLSRHQELFSYSR